MMSDQTFEVGDVVRLKSGGPAMTVTYVAAANNDAPALITCMWWESRGKPLRYTLDAPLLTRAEPGAARAERTQRMS